MTRLFKRWLTLAMCCGACALAGCGSNGSVSGGTSAPITTPPISPAPIPTTATAKFAYTGNEGASLSGYSVNNSTGALTSLNGFPFNIGVNPTVVAVDPQNRFLFAGDIAEDKLHVFTINNSTGALSEIGTSPYATVREPIAIAVDPSGTHVYVVGEFNGSVGGFSVSATGALSPIAGSPFANSDSQDLGKSTVINAAGTFVYVQGLANIYVYSVNASSGALTLVQTIAGPSFGFSIALDPHGTYLYAIGGTNSILSYSISASTGLLSPSVESPMAEQNGAYTISISPTGLFAYTIENNNDLVSYALNNGKFTPVGSVYAQVYGQQIGIDPSGSFVYVPQSCDNCPSGVYNVVYEFSIGHTGALTKIPGSPVAAGTTPFGIAFTTQ
ncbi:MAG TPA: beta-propeller fold lactonase family protein [Acidobacteriaceae bacterium]|jgi:6-phosphogluconolactonase (cycloisomerase 2 family)|nr:beta-propeller fold lactonase family protein [Acidobacteriaceae bacterium]